jgi:hypothetical protein
MPGRNQQRAPGNDAENTLSMMTGQGEPGPRPGLLTAHGTVFGVLIMGGTASKQPVSGEQFVVLRGLARTASIEGAAVAGKRHRLIVWTFATPAFMLRVRSMAAK